jgi:hypothetical protein
MAQLKCKGTVLEREIASVYTAVAQVLSIDLPKMQSETYEADTLDNANAGIPYKVTGRTEGDSVGFELFFDPALTGHKGMLALLTTPAAQNWKVKFADAGPSTWTIPSSGFSFGGKVDMKDGLKAQCSFKVDGLPTFPA